MEALDQKPWWEYLGADLQKLLNSSDFLIKSLKSSGNDLPGGKAEFDDYAFVVFPAAKAYEGFLKKLFFDLGFITEEDYYGKHFRIGKALNPSLPKELRNQSVYGKIVKYCGGKKLADELWETWRLCRNLTFHWFPDEKNVLTFPESIDRVNMIGTAMDAAFKECKVDLK
jgi:hypothetical protein